MTRGSALIRRPGLAGVVRAVETGTALRLDGREQAAGIARRHRDADAAQPVLGEGRQAADDGPPGGAAVRRLVDAAAGPVEDAVLPGRLPRLPEHGVGGARVRRIEDDVHGAGVLVAIEDLLEGLASVRRPEEAALRTRAVRTAQHGHQQAVGIARVDRDLRDLPALAQAEVAPGASAVRRLVDAVARGEVGPLQPLAAADIDDVGIGGGDGDGADGAGGLVVEDGRPGAAVVVRLPDAAVADADVEDVRAVRDARGRLGPPSSVGADHAPAQLTQQAGIVGLRVSGGGDAARGQAEQKDGGGSAHRHQACPPTAHSS